MPDHAITPSQRILLLSELPSGRSGWLARSCNRV